jgi:hypothetical protein
MIFQIDTSEIPDKQKAFWAELILLSKKNNCTIDKTIEEMKEVLNKKE